MSNSTAVPEPPAATHALAWQIPPTDPRPDTPVAGVSALEYECFAGISPWVAELREFVMGRALDSEPVLLISERGLRPEQVARALHQIGPRRETPFIAINVHSLAPEAMHELLFGASGLLAGWRHGMIYVNELASLPLLLQQRFAVHFEEQRWNRHPGATPRLVLGTHCDMAELSAANRVAYGLIEMLRFRGLTLKPLRERPEDLPALARQLVAGITRRLGRGSCELTPAALRALADYEWEGNIDELEAVLESAISMTPPQLIEESLLPARIREAMLRAIPEQGIDLQQTMEHFELSIIENAMRHTGGHQGHAARLLGLNVQTLNMKLRRFGRQKKQLRAQD
ncbi:MAG: sigma-54-dependent transcriptional regulator [Blastocatellia bacterium]